MSARFFLQGLTMLVAVSGAAQPTATRVPEALYFAVEVQQDGKTVAAPKVVGFEGKNITVERRQPDAPVADYRLILVPREEGQGYGVKLDLQLPNGRRLGHIGLLHGEERKISLGQDVEMKVLLMRVDSPEFKALVQRTRKISKTAI